jgi:hypothetical protein
MRKASRILFERDENESDPSVPLELFSFENLKQALAISQLSTLQGLGFGSSRRTPIFKGVNQLLERFNYWTDDAEHPEIFPV